MKVDEFKKKMSIANDVVKKMSTFSFLKEFEHLEYKIQVDVRENKLSRTFKGPSDESLKAFCNDLRKFIQKNDSIKIEKFCQYYNDDKLVTSEEKGRYNKIISDFNKLKSTKTYTIDGSQMTYEDLLHIFLYGDVSHTNETKRDKFEYFRESLTYPLLRGEFFTIVLKYFLIIRRLFLLNEEVLERMEGAQK